MRIGIDTGGTYTDAVLCADPRLSSGDGAGSNGRPVVLAKAKARTRVDLSVGIAEALDGVLAAAELDDRSQISLVSLSTTLATNALVEGIGGRVALVFIGFTEAELDRGGLREGLGDAPVIMVDGGHDSLGIELAPFDADAVVEAAGALDVDAFAVAGQFS
ncbi:MAG: hydantoinase/oxoprolinase N-terminal domain-containing protein, partial [Acidimicrobiales bacterium]